MEKAIKCIKNNFSKVKFYDRILWKNYLADIGVISSIVTLISFFLSAKSLNIGTSYSLIFFIGLLVVAFIRKWWKANHLKHAELMINNTKVAIREGDIFEALNKEVEERKGILNIIAVNECYDVIVDERIIAEKSLHGQYMKRIIKEGKLEKLNSVIETDEILNRQGNVVDISRRLKGRKVKYSIGSVLEFESYVLAAFTKFTENNKATLTAEEYTNFWMCFWENIDEIYAGRTINIPLIGAGITRFRNGKPTKQELLEVMLWSLKISGFHNTYGDEQINIVIYKEDIKDIDFYHIQHNQSFR